MLSTLQQYSTNAFHVRTALRSFEHDTPTPQQRLTFATMAVFCIRVVVPLALRGAFTYAVPDELAEEMVPGKRVVVPFGPRRYYAAVILETDVAPLKGAKTKFIAYVLDNEPILTEQQLSLWKWMAEYYMSTPGEVMLCALPGAMRLSSQTTVVMRDQEMEYDAFDDTERMVLANLNTRRSTSLEAIEKLGAKTKVQRAVNRLMHLGYLEMQEEITEKVTIPTVDFVRLSDDFADQDALSALMDALTRAPKQLELLMRFLHLSDYFNKSPVAVPKRKLFEVANASPSAWQALVEKGVFQVEARQGGGSQNESVDFDSKSDVSEIELSESQTNAINEINNKWKSKNVVLLHGVTGSGKTHVYVDLARKAIAAGQQVLYLVPEIALTTQLVGRIRQWFAHALDLGATEDASDGMIVYHSRYSNRERLLMWTRMLGPNPPRLIIGARSAVFLPFTNLGLTIVDEEHETSYKQQESSPFYHARDVAIWLSTSCGARVLLGSATPAVETYYQATNPQGKFALVSLKERHGQVRMPQIEVVDLKAALKNKQMQADFTPAVIEAVREGLLRKKQSIIFQNRRGFAPFQICEACGWSAECDHCDVHLCYHKRFQRLLCHYCGFSIPEPTHCPECGSPKLKIKGSGTEKVEDDLEGLFPEARIGRMDLDNTRKKQSLQNIITAFQEGSIDLLVGTQMVTKGLDFEHVSLVVVMLADALWSRPDFRAFERAWQLLTQVAGRAGRKHERGKVMIQAYQVDHPVLDLLMNGSYEAMFESQILERQPFVYPPFSRIIRLHVAHKDPALCRQSAQFLADKIRADFGDRLIGPEEPSIARVRGRYLRQMFLKLETGINLGKARAALWSSIDAFEGHEEYRKVRLSVDVDPV